MNPTDSRLPVALEATLHHVRATTSAVVERVAQHLATQSASATRISERDLMFSASQDLRHKIGALQSVFNEVLLEKVQLEIAPRSGGRDGRMTNWQSLSLVDDQQVEEQMFADRIGQQISHACEWELREVAAYMGAVLGLGRADEEHNPVRASVLGTALYRGISAINHDPEARKLLARELGQAMARAMPDCYKVILDDLHARGIQPVGLSVKTIEGPGNQLGGGNSGYATLADPTSTRSGPSGFHGSSGSEFGGSRSGLATRAGMGAGATRNSAGSTRNGAATSTGGFGGASRTGGLGGQGANHGADAQLMELLRRLTFLASRPGGLDSGSSGSGGLGAAAGRAVTDAMGLSESSGGRGLGAARHGVQATGYGDGMNGLMAVNLIRAHREELMQASSGTLDHMVIDVVGSLFDQILSDPKVSPQLARQIARLQLPVLRVALNDPSFFSSRKHPVRRFVNRIASLACAFDDFDDGPGKQFLLRVKQLVQEIVEGDFDQVDIYTAKLTELEKFIVLETESQDQAHHAAAAILEGKESELRTQQRYMLQIRAALGPINMPGYLRDFVAQVWSQALVLSVRRNGVDSDLAKRLRLAGRDVVMSVQPKGSPPARKKFLMQLPGLMKDLHEGLKLVGWPEAAQKDFFGQLLPSHAESMKVPALSELDHNLLVRQLDAVFNAPVPGHEASYRGEPVPSLPDNEVERRFTPEEAQRVGLVEESAVDWAGTVDIDLGEEAAPAATSDVSALDLNLNLDLSLGLDINLDLSAPDPAEATHGPQLIDHIKVGFAYQMHLKDEWEKVRLSFVSPGRSFFVFTHGRKHQQTVSLTSRMLARMCETGRMRAVESSYLMERATLRARKQLAALRSQPTA